MLNKVDFYQGILLQKQKFNWDTILHLFSQACLLLTLLLLLFMVSCKSLSMGYYLEERQVLHHWGTLFPDISIYVLSSFSIQHQKFLVLLICMLEHMMLLFKRKCIPITTNESRNLYRCLQEIWSHHTIHTVNTGLYHPHWLNFFSTH